MQNNAKRVIKIILIVIFLLCFLTSIGYWLYNIYYIHSTDFTANLEKDVDIMRATAHEVAAFQACVVSFLILALIIFVKF